MAVKGKALVGPILGLIGGTLLMIGGLLVLGVMGTLEATLALSGLTWVDIGLDPTLFYVNFTMTLLFGIVGLIGAILAMVGKKIGVYLMLVMGIIAVVGLFIPIGSYTLIFLLVNITLNSSLFFVDPFLLLVGGILGLALKAE